MVVGSIAFAELIDTVVGSHLSPKIDTKPVVCIYIVSLHGFVVALLGLYSIFIITIYLQFHA